MNLRLAAVGLGIFAALFWVSAPVGAEHGEVAQRGLGERAGLLAHGRGARRAGDCLACETLPWTRRDAKRC